MKQRKGFTLIELLVVIAIIALLVGLLLPALAKAQQNARSLKDKTQIKQIHAAMLVYANDSKERLPTPGLIDRLEDLQLDIEIPGVGPYDYKQNHSANLYSYMVSTQFFGTKLLIGPTEVNPFITEYVNFNFDAYDPSSDQYWDPDFNVDISQDDVDGVHVSYFHLTLVGERWRTKWRTESTHSASAVIMGSRGTKNGEITTDNYRLSQTLELHGAKNQWVGNLVFQDNHTETVVSFYPNQVIYQRQDTPVYRHPTTFSMRNSLTSR
ncbi:MAG: type II secretion system protein [Planctomycetes bacterium]|nr:type II secretion system protein [Planctomycetota bacterium]